MPSSFVSGGRGRRIAAVGGPRGTQGRQHALPGLARYYRPEDRFHMAVLLVEGLNTGHRNKGRVDRQAAYFLFSLYEERPYCAACMAHIFPRIFLPFFQNCMQKRRFCLMFLLFFHVLFLEHMQKRRVFVFVHRGGGKF